MLRESGLNFTTADSMGEAADPVAEQARRQGRSGGASYGGRPSRQSSRLIVEGLDRA